MIGLKKRARAAGSDARRSRERGSYVVLTVALALFMALPHVERIARASGQVVLAVVVARESAVENVRLSELKRVFSNEGDSDSSGQRYVPFNHPPHTTDRVGFDKTVLGMSPDEVSQFWIERRIRGLAGPPRSVDSLSLLLRLVARLPGGITYVRAAQVTGDVRAVRVNGKLAGDVGYPVMFEE